MTIKTLASTILTFLVTTSQSTCADTDGYESRSIAGWTVQVHAMLAQSDLNALEQSLKLLEGQLDEIIQSVPGEAVKELQKVTLWFSPEYPNTPPRAEYHPNAEWLRSHGRNPAMAKGIEFTNVRIFEAETRRMPNFALHELAHAYHDCVLRLGFANLDVKAAYQEAKAGGSYERVERRDSKGESRFERAYAMTNAQEYFAELTEAYFSRNDFFPFHRTDLQQHDPKGAAMLKRLWRAGQQP